MSVIFKQLRQSANNIYENCETRNRNTAKTNGSQTTDPGPLLATPKK